MYLFLYIYSYLYLILEFLAVVFMLFLYIYYPHLYGLKCIKKKNSKIQKKTVPEFSRLNYHVKKEQKPDRQRLTAFI